MVWSIVEARLDLGFAARKITLRPSTIISPAGLSRIVEQPVGFDVVGKLGELCLGHHRRQQADAPTDRWKATSRLGSGGSVGSPPIRCLCCSCCGWSDSRTAPLPVSPTRVFCSLGLRTDGSCRNRCRRRERPSLLAAGSEAHTRRLRREQHRGDLRTQLRPRPPGLAQQGRHPGPILDLP